MIDPKQEQVGDNSGRDTNFRGSRWIHGQWCGIVLWSAHGGLRRGRMRWRSAHTGDPKTALTKMKPLNRKGIVLEEFDGQMSRQEGFG
jgi:hypothetical protein